MQPIGLAIVALSLVLIATTEGRWWLLLLWPAGNLLTLSWAYAKGVHRIFGKDESGRLPPLRTVLFFPFLFPLWLIWHAARIVSRESPFGRVDNSLVVGRRLLSNELREDFDNYIDLTAEFSAPKRIGNQPAYLSFPILDASTPDPVALRDFLQRLKPGRTFVHCAQGHGRTGLIALAILLTSRKAKSPEEGLHLLKQARSGIRLNRNQNLFIRRFADSIDSKA